MAGRRGRSSRGQNLARRVNPATGEDGSPAPDPASSPAPAPRRRIQHASVEFAGPLPPPGILAGYDGVIPGAANRILIMAEQQHAHRVELERHIVRSDVLRSYAGMMCAVVLSLAIIWFAHDLAMNGHEATAAIMVGGDILALVGSFAYGTHSRRQERVQKASPDRRESQGTSRR